jgi:phospholipase/carboxylesterase
MIDEAGSMATDHSSIRQINGFTVRERRPPGPGPHRIIVLLHGWTGDINSMWVFAGRLPKTAWLVAPQAPFISMRGGYSWRDENLRPAPALETDPDAAATRRLPSLEELRPAANDLLAILTTTHFPGGETQDGHRLIVDLVGFSQGGALAFSLALLYPDRVRRIAGLSTFMPPGADVLTLREPFMNLPVFIAHGSLDTIVPPFIARQAVAMLEQAGADVAYCESDVGHKLGRDCFFALENFMR